MRAQRKVWGHSFVCWKVTNSCSLVMLFHIILLGCLCSSPPFSCWKSTNQNSLVKHSWAQQQKQQLQNCHLFWRTDGIITIPFKCFPNGYVHPQCPRSQYFHQLLQLFRTHSFLPPHIPRELSSLAYGYRRMFNISPDSSTSPSPRDKPSTREKETRIESWMKGSQPAMPTPWKKKHRHLSSFDFAAVNAVLGPSSPARRFLPFYALCNHSKF